MKKYFFAFFIFIVLLAALILFYHRNNFDTPESILTWMIYIYFCVLTVLFHYGIVRTTESRPQVFIRYYMAATTIKLLLHLGIIVIYSIFHRDLAIRFIFTFMIMYFLFTIFEVMLVWRRIRE